MRHKNRNIAKRTVSKCSRKTLTESLVCHFKDRLLTFHVNGYAKLLCFNDNAMIGLKLVKETAVNEVEIVLQTCANTIKEECKMADISSTEYRTSIDRTIAREVVSETVLRLLETISPRFADSLSQIFKFSQYSVFQFQKMKEAISD